MTNNKKTSDSFNSIFNLGVTLPAVVSRDAFDQESPGGRGRRRRGLSSLIRRSASVGNALDQSEAHAAADKMLAAWGNGARSLALQQEAELLFKTMMSNYYPAE